MVDKGGLLKRVKQNDEASEGIYYMAALSRPRSTMDPPSRGYQHG